MFVHVCLCVCVEGWYWWWVLGVTAVVVGLVGLCGVVCCEWSWDGGNGVGIWSDGSGCGGGVVAVVMGVRGVVGSGGGVVETGGEVVVGWGVIVVMVVGHEW